MKKKRNTHDNIVLLAKTNLNIIKIWTSKALIDLYVIYEEFVSVKMC